MQHYITDHIFINIHYKFFFLINRVFFCRFFIGKNKLMKLALGDDEKHEIKPNISKIAEVCLYDHICIYCVVFIYNIKNIFLFINLCIILGRMKNMLPHITYMFQYNICKEPKKIIYMCFYTFFAYHLLLQLLVGNRILLITKDEPLKVIKFFNEFQPEEYIIHGNISKENIVLKCGEVLNAPVSMQKDLQKLKVNFDIVDQKIIIKEDKVLAEKDKLVSLENAKLLRMLNMKIGKFDISVLAYWHSNNFVSLMHK